MVLSVFITAIVIAGFRGPYFGPLLRSAASRPWLIHIRGIVFVGWMALVLVKHHSFSLFGYLPCCWPWATTSLLGGASIGRSSLLLSH
jgi:hypothetical protein